MTAHSRHPGLVAIMALACAMIAAAAHAASPQQIYHDKCAICHDDGGGGAPRIGNKAEWATRLAQGRAVIHRNSIAGIPGTAMVARGGFPELSNADVIAAADYLLASVGVPPDRHLPDTRAAAPAAARPAGPYKPVDDATLAMNVRNAVAREKDVALSGIKIAARDGVVTLAGVVDTGDQIRRIAAAVSAEPGVKKLENNLQTKGMFAFD